MLIFVVLAEQYLYYDQSRKYFQFYNLCFCSDNDNGVLIRRTQSMRHRPHQLRDIVEKKNNSNMNGSSLIIKPKIFIK